MVRARLARVALVAALGVACGCSTPSSCSSCSRESFTSRLTGLFRRDRGTPVEVVGEPGEGPVIPDPGTGPGPYEGPGCMTPPQTFAPPPQPFAPPPQPFAPLPQSRAPPLYPPPQPSPY